MTRKIALAALILTALAACGLRGPLQPVAGQSAPLAPRFAARAPTTEEMMTPPVTARPIRLDEPLTRSEERTSDRFDLPPPDIGNGQVPIPQAIQDRPQ